MPGYQDGVVFHITEGPGVNWTGWVTAGAGDHIISPVYGLESLLVRGGESSHHAVTPHHTSYTETHNTHSMDTLYTDQIPMLYNRLVIEVLEKEIMWLPHVPRNPISSPSPALRRERGRGSSSVIIISASHIHLPEMKCRFHVPPKTSWYEKPSETWSS